MDKGKVVGWSVVGGFNRSLEKIVEGFEPLSIFAKRSMLDVWHGSEYVSAAGTHFSVAKKLTQQ